MSYARNLLSRGEEVVHESRQHWLAVLGEAWIWVLVAIVALALLLWVGGSGPVLNNETVDGIVTIIGLAAILAAIFFIGIAFWRWRNQEWLVTTRRVIRAEGIFNKQMLDSNLEKINDAMLNQSLLGRIFGFGTLDILTAAEERGAMAALSDFPMVADPVQFKIAMLNQKELLERPDLAPPRYQRASAAPEMQRADALPPRAGSDRVAEVHAEAAPLPPIAEPAAAIEPPPAATREPSAAESVADTLERLAALRDKGLITPEEYEAKKTDLLGRM